MLQCKPSEPAEGQIMIQARERDSEATRRRLIDATAQLISEHGYTAVSEPRVCEIAGLTRGALRHHFRTGKYGMVAALAGELFAALPKPNSNRAKDRAVQLLEFLSEAPEGNPLVMLLEIWFASRTDKKLADAIQPNFSANVAGLFSATSAGALSASVMPYRFMLHGAILEVYSGNYDPAKLKLAVRKAAAL